MPADRAVCNTKCSVVMNVFTAGEFCSWISASAIAENLPYRIVATSMLAPLPAIGPGRPRSDVRSRAADDLLPASCTRPELANLGALITGTSNRSEHKESAGRMWIMLRSCFLGYSRVWA